MMESADLPAGATAFEWFGPKTGPVAVCIHGLTTPSYIFAGTARSLATLGFRTLTYDLWGRGGSETPNGRQSPDFFLDQLNGLLAHQGVSGPVVLVGYSMGAALAVRHAVETEFRPRALVLLAPAGLVAMPGSLSGRLSILPGVGEVWASTIGPGALRRTAEAGAGLATLVPDLVARQISETERDGYAASVVSSLRHTLSMTYDDDHRAIRDLGVPTLAVWGAEDAVIGKRAISRLAELNPNARHVEIAGAGHLLPQTHPREVAEALRGFL